MHRDGDVNLGYDPIEERLSTIEDQLEAILKYLNIELQETRFIVLKRNIKNDDDLED